jgi:hypothetical protein
VPKREALGWGPSALIKEAFMIALSQFLLHTTKGRILLLALFLVLSLFIASAAGWLPALY